MPRYIDIVSCLYKQHYLLYIRFSYVLFRIHHKTTFPGERYNTGTKVSATHTSYSKITVLRSCDIDCSGVHIDIAPVDDIEGFNGKDNNSYGLESDPDMK